MTKYIFKKLRDETNHYDLSDIVMKVEATTLDEIFEEFSNFLKASGFSEQGINEYLNKYQE